jgi:hypothetical protein
VPQNGIAPSFIISSLGEKQGLALFFEEHIWGKVWHVYILAKPAPEQVVRIHGHRAANHKHCMPVIDVFVLHYLPVLVVTHELQKPSQVVPRQEHGRMFIHVADFNISCDVVGHILFHLLKDMLPNDIW